MKEDQRRLGRACPERSEGIQQFRNRAYDPATGTWIQEDPMGVAGGVNLYRFNNGNPVGFGDPLGLMPCTRDERKAGKETVASEGGLICVERSDRGQPDDAAQQQCFENNRFSALFGGGAVSDAVSVAETGSLLSVGADLVAIGFKATRSGVGGSSNQYASGFNMVGRSIAKTIGGRISKDPAVTGRLVKGVRSVGDILGPTLLLIAAGTTAFNTATDVQCRLGVIK